MALLIRTDSKPEALAPAVRAAVRSIDPDLAVSALRPFREVFWNSIASRTMALTWMAVFALMALILAAIGIYGVVTGAVARRTREFGIRMALGADGQDLLRMAVRQGMVPVLAGVGIGLAGATALTRLLESKMPGITAVDAPVFAAAAAVLILVALAASYVPARRAVRLDPMAALRSE
jgi:putative ABC transport system permease protein